MIVVDVETTGTDEFVHSLVSIGAVDFEHPERQFYEECRVWEGAHVEPEALAINGFSVGEIHLPSKKTDAEALASFFSWAAGAEVHTLAGMNPSLDIGFLRQTAKRNHIDFFLAKRTIDLHTVCYTHMARRGMEPPTEKGRSAIDSDFVMRYVGIPPEPHPHIALNGALWETEALSRLLYGTKKLPEFAMYEILCTK